MSSSKAKISIEKQLHYAEKGEQGGVDIREPSTALLGIQSSDRYAGKKGTTYSNPASSVTQTSPYDFTLNTPAQNLMTGFFTRLAVNEVQFKWSIPTLTSRNNKIIVNVNPQSNGTITNIASVSGTSVTFTFATTTNYQANMNIQVTGLSGTQAVYNGIYKISSVTGTTLVCNNPNGVGTLTTTSSTGGTAFIRTDPIVVPEGWYDIYNQTISTNTAQGNLAYQLQLAVIAGKSGGVSIGTALASFLCVYNLSPTTSLTPVVSGQPYNAFYASNLVGSGGACPFWFERYIELTRPNAIGLFDMMGWIATQTSQTFQYSTPDATMLSTPFVDIVCDGLTYNQALKDGDSGDISRTILCRVFLTPDAFTGNATNLGSAPILIHRVFPFPKQIKWNANQPIGNLRFQVYDSEGYLLTTFDGVSGTQTNPPAYFDSDMADWSMTLLVSEV
jgi:hypothetical protein